MTSSLGSIRLLNSASRTVVMGRDLSLNVMTETIIMGMDALLTVKLNLGTLAEEVAQAILIAASFTILMK